METQNQTVSCLPNDAEINQVKRIADKITLKQAHTMQWSTYHLWKMVSSLRSTDLAVKLAAYRSLWQEQPHPRYGTCVDFAYIWAKQLRAELSAVPHLAHYAQNVKLYAARYTDRVTGEKGEPEHVIPVLTIGTAIIFSDICIQPDAILLRSGEKRDLRPSVTFGNDVCGVSYKYFCLKRPPFRGALTFFSGSLSRKTQVYGMSEISWDDAIVQLNFKLAGEMVRCCGERVPSAKHFIAESYLEEKPSIPCVETALGYRVSMCKVGVYFDSGRISVMVPLEDWLDKPENSGYRERLAYRHIPVRRLTANSMGVLGLCDIGSDDDTHDARIELLAEIVEKLNIDKCEFLKAVNDVLHEEYQQPRLLAI